MPLPDSSKNKKLPSLDGWRAVSISLLLLGHSVFTPGFPSFAKAFNSQGTGILGVRFFFVISGFLITWLLVGEREKTGSINLNHFYARRVLRIFPVNYVHLAVLGLLTAFRQPASAWLANFTYTTNFFPTGFPTSHLWSLAVEEQFYLLWPFLLCLLPEVAPYRKGTMTACKRCDYQSICRIDPWTHRFRVLKKEEGSAV